MLTSLEFHNVHRRIFQFAPKLLALSQCDGVDILDPFLQWAEQQKISMNWTAHLHLLNWLMQQEKLRTQINAGIVKELLTAAVIRWSLNGLDHIAAKGIMVTSKHMPGVAAGLWKNKEANKTSKVIIIKLPDNSRLVQDSYAISYQEESWEGVQWVAQFPL